MAPLNRNNLRDLVIEQALRDGVSILELNEILERHRFPCLNVTRCKGREVDRAFYYPIDSTTYDECSVSILPYDVAGEDADRSLHERYRPDRFCYHSEMIIRAKESNVLSYRITLDDGGCYEIIRRENNKEELLYSNNTFWHKYVNTVPCEDANLLNEVAKLKEYRDQRARYVHRVCGDTRNYRSRFDAKNDNGRLVLYGECFNNDAPELCEYCQLEVSSLGLVFSVSNTSRFLWRYLGEESWMKLYGYILPPVNQEYASLEEITESRWKMQFQALMDSARELLIQLQDRTLFLCNVRAWVNIDELMHIFHVEEAFDCIQPDDMSYEIVPRREQIIGPDGKPITIDDLYRAAELDIFTLEDLCDIRTRYGSLEHFLNIDLITEQKENVYL